MGGSTPKTIDEAVSRVLRVKFQLGLFEHPYVDENEAGFALAIRHTSSLPRRQH